MAMEKRILSEQARREYKLAADRWYQRRKTLNRWRDCVVKVKMKGLLSKKLSLGQVIRERDGSRASIINTLC